MSKPILTRSIRMIGVYIRVSHTVRMWQVSGATSAVA